MEEHRGEETNTRRCAVCSFRNVKCLLSCPFIGKFFPDLAKDPHIMQMLSSMKKVHGPLAAEASYVSTQLKIDDRARFVESFYWLAENWAHHPAEGAYFEFKKLEDEYSKLQAEHEKLESLFKQKARFLDNRSFEETKYVIDLVQLFVRNKGNLNDVAIDLEAGLLPLADNGDIFIEVLFLGCNTSPGPLEYSFFVLGCDIKTTFILNMVLFLQRMIRKWPSLEDSLDTFVLNFQEALGLFGELDRTRFAVFAAISFSKKLPGLTIEALLKPLLVEKFVESQLAITFLKEFFKEFMKYNSIGYLIELLRMGRMMNSLLMFLPKDKRSLDYFSTHFDNVEYEDLVTQMRLYLLKDELLKLQPAELSTKLAEVRDMLQPHPVSQVLPFIVEVILCPEELSSLAVDKREKFVKTKVKAWGNLLRDICDDEEAFQLELIKSVQNFCLQNELIMFFLVILKTLNQQGILVAKVIISWFDIQSGDLATVGCVDAMASFINCLRQLESIVYTV